MDYQDKHGNRVTVTKTADGRTYFHQAGGGFEVSMLTEFFNGLYEPAPEPTFRRGVVTAEFLEGLFQDPGLPCWSDGSLWNGWSMPYFSKETINRLINAGMAVTWEGDNVIALMDGEREEYTPRTMPDGTVTWGLGAGGWTWDEVRFLPPDPDGKNAERAGWAASALAAFEQCTGTDRCDALADLLDDLLHWCDRSGFYFEYELQRARAMYVDETRGES